MKKITLLAALFAVFAMNSQVTVFEEDFDGTGPGFAAWTATDVDAQDPNANDYSQAVNTQGWAELDFDTQVLPVLTGNSGGNGTLSGNVMGAHSWYAPIGQSDDWIVSPQIDLSGASGLIELNFEAMSVAGNPNFGEDYRVLVSTTGTDISADFTEVLDVELESNDMPTIRTIDLSAFAGMAIYIAWNNDSNDRWGVVIDNVVVEAATLGLEDQTFNGFSQFVDTDNNLRLSANTSMENLQLFNVLGQQVLTQKLSSNNETVNIASLRSGVYIATVTINGQNKSFKIVKR